MRVFITGSSGLIGSELVRHFDRIAQRVVGADNDQRAALFGPEGDTTAVRDLLLETTRSFRHVPLDVRDREGLARLFGEEGPFDLIVHAAGQPSEELATLRPGETFDLNAVGALNVLEATRLHSPEALLVHVSTRKVYGDALNERPLVELPTRWDYARREDLGGVDERTLLDRTTRSVFGASALAADLMVQEYGRTFGLRTVVLRCGCVAGPSQVARELHGFLAHLTRSHLQGRRYQIHGHDGKQVRDHLHCADVAQAIAAIQRAPRPGEVYNLGGGRANACSIVEAMARLEELTGARTESTYLPTARPGDAVCYISDVSRFRAHYPDWAPTRSLDDILVELVRAFYEGLPLPRRAAA
jgi:CDP-paratose 2-epimerase